MINFISKQKNILHQELVHLVERWCILDGGAPKVLVKQKGCRVWDVDGNQYIDMVMGCGPVTLGRGNNKTIKQ